ncbi:hypothetical protein FVE85_5718 [Porphyridium purpureum]|uniref:Uncharacterized protein n=1 Tax=Porphyridium purpureum TaxID=35688 RepID=A0A5J4Z5K9_PORPP|nr:hypothetical protein FVE85_5718 [Porphyridium purpureum]|eukprot:POR7419..scf295_1
MIHGVKRAFVRPAQASSHRADTSMNDVIERYKQVKVLVEVVSRIWLKTLPENYRALTTSHTELTENVVRLAELVDKDPVVHPDIVQLNGRVPDLAHACSKRSRELAKLVSTTFELDRERVKEAEQLKLMLDWLQTKLKNIGTVLELREKSICEFEYYSTKQTNLESVKNPKKDTQEKLERTISKKVSNDRDVARANEKVRLGLAKVGSVLGYVVAKLMHAYIQQSGAILNVPFLQALLSCPEFDALVLDQAIDAKDIENVAATRAAQMIAGQSGHLDSDTESEAGRRFELQTRKSQSSARSKEEQAGRDSLSLDGTFQREASTGFGLQAVELTSRTSSSARASDAAYVPATVSGSSGNQKHHVKRGSLESYHNAYPVASPPVRLVSKGPDGGPPPSNGVFKPYGAPPQVPSVPPANLYPYPEVMNTFGAAPAEPSYTRVDTDEDSFKECRGIGL